jgi:hypothetical protein
VLYIWWEHLGNWRKRWARPSGVAGGVSQTRARLGSGWPLIWGRFEADLRQICAQIATELPLCPFYLRTLSLRKAPWAPGCTSKPSCPSHNQPIDSTQE